MELNIDLNQRMVHNKSHHLLQSMLDTHTFSNKYPIVLSFFSFTRISMKVNIPFIITIFTLIIITLLLYSLKPCPKPKIIYKQPLFQQSPEYRYPTKCFDCIHEETIHHLNPSHGGRTSVGL